MDNLFLIWFGVLVRLFRSRGKLVLENLALRQQLAVLKRRHPRPRLDLFDKLFWVIAHQFWSTWQEALILVTPETVVRWHRTGFRFYWRLISRVGKPAGRRRVSKEVRDLIFRMVAENTIWGAPRIGLSFRPSLYMYRTGTFPAPRNILALHGHSCSSSDLFTLGGGSIAPFSKWIVSWRGSKPAGPEEPLSTLHIERLHRILEQASSETESGVQLSAQNYWA